VDRALLGSFQNSRKKACSRAKIKWPVYVGVTSVCTRARASFAPLQSHQVPIEVRRYPLLRVLCNNTIHGGANVCCDTRWSCRLICSPYNHNPLPPKSHAAAQLLCFHQPLLPRPAGLWYMCTAKYCVAIRPTSLRRIARVFLRN